MVTAAMACQTLDRVRSAIKPSNLAQTQVQLTLNVKQTIQGIWKRQKALVIVLSHRSAWGIMARTAVASPAAPALDWKLTTKLSCKTDHAPAPRFQAVVSPPLVPAMTPIAVRSMIMKKKLTSQGGIHTWVPMIEVWPSAEVSRLAWRRAATVVPHATCHTPVKMAIQTRA